MMKMKADSCFYCRKNSELQNLMLEIQPLKISTLYLNRDQTYKGRCILAFNDHKREIFELNVDERKMFIEDISTSAKILQNVFSPQKINYGIFGDLVSHLHVHIVPKYEGEKNWGKAFINSPQEKLLLQEREYDELVKQVKYHLSKVEELK